jgi:1-acyl-sn-glycerol-3-phosphate acyltransferase
LALNQCVLLFCLARLRGPITLERRTQWLQQCGRLVMAGMGIELRVEGKPPAQGLLISNHLSYLDIVAYCAATPCFMVSKKEVSRWPFFGMLARWGGTLFLDRSRLASAEAVARQIIHRLCYRAPILLFPEGTSSDGSQVLRFHTRLIEPAVVAQAPVTAAAIRYVVLGGQERDLCWFDDSLFLPHLWKVLGTAGFSAAIRFGEPRIYPDRRTAARETHAEVTAMRELGAPAREQATAETALK